MTRRFLQVLLAAVSLLITAVVAESVLDVLAASEAVAPGESPRPFYTWSFDTSTGARIGRKGELELAMDPAAVYVNLENQTTRFFTTDGNGFRGPRRSTPRGDGPMIVVLGGSTAFGTGLDRDDDTFSSLLEASIPGSTVINAAVIGHLSGQELGHLVARLVDLHPDLVIALDGFNDLVDQIGGPPRIRRTAGFNNTFLLMERRLREYYVLESGSLLDRAAAAVPLVFRNLARLVTDRIPLDGFGPSAQGRAGSPSVPWVRSDALSLARIYAANVAKMDRVADAFGARMLCVLQPYQSSFPNGGRRDETGNQYSRFRREARRRLEEAGVEHIDLNDFAERIDGSMFMDRIHLDARGNEAMAELVRETIDGRGLLEKGGSG